MNLSCKQYGTIRKWIYRNARPLDIARWKYHFENGGKGEVLTALSMYQNEDGGFAHGLEADNWNPNSSPIQTWCATEILYELEMKDKNHPIVQGILAYLSEKRDFHDGYWDAVIPSNNEFPRAPWWSYKEDVNEEWGYNPTVCLAGFALYFSEEGSELYNSTLEIAKKAVHTFMESKILQDMHEGLCFIRFYEYCVSKGIDLFDSNTFRNKLQEMVSSLITKDTQEWKTKYICKPSQFLLSSESIFYEDNREISQYETMFIINSLHADGSWDIPWNWGQYEKEWSISKNWWKANQSIVNMRYLEGFGCFSIDKKESMMYDDVKF